MVRLASRVDTEPAAGQTATPAVELPAESSH